MRSMGTPCSEVSCVQEHFLLIRRERYDNGAAGVAELVDAEDLKARRKGRQVNVS